MLALKKKREAEAKAAAEEAARAKEEPASAENGAGKTEKVSLFGIGGQKKNKNGDGKTGKKRSPGEIRIQKGKMLRRVQLGPSSLVPVTSRPSLSCPAISVT